MREIASFGGHTYGMWFKGTVNALVWYQPSVLRRLGIGVPTTWQQLDIDLAAIERERRIEPALRLRRPEPYLDGAGA